MPDSVMNLVVQLAIVAIAGLIAWYAYNEIKAKHHAQLADLKEAHAKLVAEKDDKEQRLLAAKDEKYQEVQRVTESLREEIAKLTTAVDALSRKLGKTEAGS